MPDSEFSEFSFGFAFTQEVTSLCWESLTGAPVMPSLFDEGRGGGYDVAVQLWGWTLFAQFKRGFRTERNTAREWPTYHQPYYRYDIYQPSRSTQHQALLNLEEAHVLNWVAYVSPVFSSTLQLNHLFLNRSILDNVRMIRPAEIGQLDADPHRITYCDRNDAPILHSEPIAIEAVSVREVRNLLARRNWEQTGIGLEDRTPSRISQPYLLDNEYFVSLYQEILQAARDSEGSQPQVGLGDSLSSLSPFGRARIAARLLLGAELILLPAAGQEVVASG
jgi:hypothetical protein